MQILGFTYFCQDLASQRKCASMRDNRNGFCSCFRASSGRCQWHRERERDHFCVVRERDIYIYTCNTVLKKCEEMRCTIGVAWSWKSDRTYVLLKNRSVISHLGNDGLTNFRQSVRDKGANSPLRSIVLRKTFSCFFFFFHWNKVKRLFSVLLCVLYPASIFVVWHFRRKKHKITGRLKESNERPSPPLWSKSAKQTFFRARQFLLNFPFPHVVSTEKDVQTYLVFLLYFVFHSTTEVSV